MVKGGLLTIFFSMIVLCLLGQTLNFHSYYVSDGLAQSQITDIASDDKGFIWFATYGGGVDKFDGRTFINYGLNEGMRHHQIKKLFIDNKQKVWCGLENGFISVIEHNTVVNIERVDAEEYAITAMQEKGETMLIGNENSDMFLVSSDYTVNLYVNFGGGAINDIAVMADDVYVAVKNNGLYRADGENKEKLLALDDINAIEVHNELIYIGTSNALLLYDTKSKQLKKLIRSSNLINDIIYDNSNDVLWISIYGSGLGKFQDGKLEVYNETNGLTNNFTTSLHKDKFGLLWIGTDGGGVSKFMGFQFVHYRFSQQHAGVAVLDILNRDGDYWFATYGNGIIKKAKNGKITIYNKDNYLPTNAVYSMIEDMDGRLFLATKSDGLVVFNPDTRRCKVFNSTNSIISDQLLYITKTNDGDFCLASRNHGIFIKYKNRWIQIDKSNGLPENHINNVFFDETDNMWLATESNGVVFVSHNHLKNVLDQKQKNVYPRTYDNIQGLKNPQVFSITKDKSGRMWYATFGGGLAYQYGDKINHITKADGLVSNNIYGIAVDTLKNVLWVATDRGISSIYIPKSGNEVVKIESFSVNEGFTGVECNRNAICFEHDSRVLWVGTIKGVTRFSPDDYTPPVLAPQIVFTGFNYKGKEISISESGVFRNNNKLPIIPYDSNSVVISFKAIDQWQPNKLIYQWQLKGLEETWHNPSNDNVVEYNFLPPGKYIFNVKAMNSRGIISTKSQQLSFIVQKPFWLSWGFYILLLILLIILIIVFFYFRQKQLKNRNLVLQRAVEERTKQLHKEKLVVEQHREELRAQTEHLELANRELEKLSLVAAKTDNAVMIADKNGKWEWANEGFTKMYGYTLQEFIQARGETIADSSSSNKITHIIDEALYHKKSVVFTTRSQGKNEKEIWVQSTLTPVFDEHNVIKRFVVIDSDISHIKKINNELRKLSLVASKTDNSVIVMDRNGKIDWVNDSFHKFYDLSLDAFKEMYNKTFYDLHPDLKERFKPEKIFEERKSKTFITQIQNEKGRNKWIQSVITPIMGTGMNGDQIVAVETDITRIKEVEAQIQKEKEKSDKLLLNILPNETAEELKSRGYAQPRYYDSASVMFTDFKNFTVYCERMEPKELIDELREYFDRFDDIAERFYVEKIKTIGDAFMCAGGLPIRNRSHPFDIILAGLEMQKVTCAINERKIRDDRQPWEIRIGIHTGDLVAGVVGKIKFAYDIWGDTVNIASRMESACEPGRVNISGSTYELVKEFFECTYRGKIQAKNIGKFDMYFVDGIKPDYSINGLGAEPNEKFRRILSQF